MCRIVSESNQAKIYSLLCSAIFIAPKNVDGIYSNQGLHCYDDPFTPECNYPCTNLTADIYIYIFIYIYRRKSSRSIREEGLMGQMAIRSPV